MLLWIMRAHNTNLRSRQHHLTIRSDAAVLDATIAVHLVKMLPWLCTEGVIFCFVYFAG